jgi:methylase of polypeptide subunit release factors
MFDFGKPSPATASLRPSDYTAALLHALGAEPDRVRGAAVLEIGSGSGVVLAALAGMGAASLCGVDIEEEAVDTGRSLLRGLGHEAELLCGDMWSPVAGRRFDLIVANLPHFPMEHCPVSGRRASWSSGGPDGRELLDPFIEGLRDHLSPSGRAVITHNAFVDLERSRAVAARHGLALRVILSVQVYVAVEKAALMTPAVLAAEQGRSIRTYGPHVFADMHIVELAATGASG